MKWRVTMQLSSVIFKVKWPLIRPHCIQIVTKYCYIHGLHSYIIELGGDFQQRKASTSQLVTLNEHPSTLGLVTGLRKADQSTFGSGVVVFIDGGIDWQ